MSTTTRRGGWLALALGAMAAAAGAGCDGDSATSADGGAPVAAPTNAGRWESLAPVPGTPRMYAGVAAAGDRVFIVGGSASGGGLLAGPEARLAHAYDPKTNTWAAIDPLPEPIPMPNVVTAGGKLFVAGGLRTSNVYEYDVAMGRWRPRQGLPVSGGRGVAAIGAWGTKIVVAGGITPGQSANALNTGRRERETMLYDAEKDTWELLGEMPLPRGYAMAAVVGDQLWVVGGSTDFVRTDQIDVLDLKTRTWADRKPLGETLSSAGVAVAGGRIYVIGGIASETGMITPDALALDPSTQTRTPIAPLPTPRFAMNAAALGGKIYVPGGIANVRPPMGYAAVGTLEAFVPSPSP